MSGYPSVTQVLGRYIDYSMVKPEVLDAACRRGSAVHQHIWALLTGGWSPKLPEEYQGYIDSFNAWYRMAVDEWVACEEEYVCNAYRFMGHPDLVCRLRGDDRLTLVDFKTPEQLHDTWALQLAAYAHLAGNHGYEIDRIMILRLQKDGKPGKINEYSRHKSYFFNTFLCALKMHEFLTRTGGWHD